MNKKEYLQSIGKTLVEYTGKQKFYNAQQIDNAHEKVSNKGNIESLMEGAELLEFAFALYAPVDDFISKFSKSASKYLELKVEAIKEISNTDSFAKEELSHIEFDLSWLDIGDLFEGIFEGIGAFLEGIFS